MKSRPKLVFASTAFGVMAFVVAFSLGTAITLATGIPLSGGLLNGVLTAMILTVGILSTRFFGTATLMWFVFALCAVVTTTLGPPGAYKVVIGVVAGLIWDLCYRLSKRTRWGLYGGALLGASSIMFTLIFALKLGFGTNAAEALVRYQSALYVLLAINLFVTGFGVFLGDMVFRKRFSKLKVFQDLEKHVPQ